MAYLDGELSPEAAAQMTAQLTQCRACQDVAAGLQVVSRQLSGWTVEGPKADSGLPANVAATLEARGRELRSSLRFGVGTFFLSTVGRRSVSRWS